MLTQHGTSHGTTFADVACFKSIYWWYTTYTEKANFWVSDSEDSINLYAVMYFMFFSM